MAKAKPFKTRKPSDEVKKHQLLVLQGLDKTGKTHFACTGPSPMLVISTDLGDKGVITPEKFPGKEIEILDLVPGSELVASNEEDLAPKVWEEFLQAHEWCLENKWSMVWDKADQIWELARLVLLIEMEGELGKKIRSKGGMSAKPHHFTPVNMAFKNLIKQVDRAGLNLTLIHNMKEEWVGGQTTGRYIRSGFKETGGLVDTVVNCSFEDGVFGGRIEFCRQNMDLCGEELTGIEWDYDTLLERIFDAE